MIYRLALSLTAVLPCVPAQEADPQRSLADKIDALFRKTLKGEEPGGAVIAIVGGKTIIRRGYGRASMELGVPVDPAMVFCLGSVTKPFTAVAIMQLVERRKLGLADRAGQHLPGLELDERITVEHLLTHTSGLKDLMRLPGFGPETIHREFQPDELCAAVKGQPLEFAPGSRFRYSNSNYALLARIVARVSGQRWENYLQANVYAPAKMTRTMFGGHDRVIPGRVTSYTKRGRAWARSRAMSFSRGYGLGGLFSNVDDLARWATALGDGTLLEAGTLARMQTPGKLPDGKASRYALGWFVRDVRGYRCVYHGGGIFGWRCMVVRIPAQQVFVAVLTNRDDRDNGAPNDALRVAVTVAREAGK